MTITPQAAKENLYGMARILGALQEDVFLKGESAKHNKDFMSALNALRVWSKIVEYKFIAGSNDNPIL